MSMNLVKTRAWGQGIILMLLVTFIWASMPIAIKDLIERVSPSVQIFIRFSLGAIVCAPFADKLNFAVIRDGAITGSVFFGGVIAETIALKTIPANQASFIYGLILIFVTLFEALYHRRLSWLAFIAAAISFSGIGVMSWQDGPPPLGEAWMLVCALLAASWVILLEIFAPRHSFATLTFTQLASVTILAFLWAAPEIMSDPQEIWLEVTQTKNLLILVYLGVVATGMNTWLQTKAISMITAFEAGLIETLEPFMGAMLAFVFLRETFRLQGYVGAAITIAGMLLALSTNKKTETAEKLTEMKESQTA